MTEQSLEYALIGDSAVMHHLRRLIVKVAPKKLSVLIHGATGSGKELVAGALHVMSGRPGNLVALNICAIAEPLFEDALFGHVRNAFTGAAGEIPGYLCEAHGGTVFFDEVSGLDLRLQLKLLRAVETGCYRRVGAKVDMASDFRVVSATNEDLRALGATGRFREDLRQRLSGFVIRVPSLCERLDDVPALARHFLRGVDDAEGFGLSRGALETLVAYDWPGNVRELKHVIERAVVLATTSEITAVDIHLALTDEPTARHATRLAKLEERGRLVEMLERHGWDTAKAAFELGKSRSTVYRRMERCSIARPSGNGRAANGNGAHH